MCNSSSAFACALPGVSRVPGTPGTGSSPAPSVFDSIAGDAEALEPYDEIAARYKDLSGTMSSIDASGVPAASSTQLAHAKKISWNKVEVIAFCVASRVVEQQFHFFRGQFRQTLRFLPTTSETCNKREAFTPPHWHKRLPLAVIRI